MQNNLKHPHFSPPVCSVWDKGYSYGYQGFEIDNEVKGEGNHLAFGDYGYDPRTGRRWTVDKHTFKYPYISPYASFNNNPIIYSDPDGKDAIITIKGNVITVSTTIYIYGKDATASAASSIQQSIMSNWAKQSNGKDWTYTDPKTKQTYNVQIFVSVQLYNDKEKQDPSVIPDAWNPLSRNNYIEVDNSTIREHVTGGDEGQWTTNTSWVAAHEWGHLVGLDDQYTDPPGRGSSVPNDGWTGNMMASVNGTVDQRNIDGIVGDAVKDFNNKKEFAESYNRIRDAMIKGGARFIPPKIVVPTEQRYEIDTNNPSN